MQSSAKIPNDSLMFAEQHGKQNYWIKKAIGLTHRRRPDAKTIGWWQRMMRTARIHKYKDHPRSNHKLDLHRSRKPEKI